MEPIEVVSEILNKDDKTMKVEHIICTNFNTKSDGKQAKGCSQIVQLPKENYIHVRARRGRATNSHSLAERVPSFLYAPNTFGKNSMVYIWLNLSNSMIWQIRREKISERMKLLQDLVPGCNQVILHIDNQVVILTPKTVSSL